jgi:hypothetical protein
VSDVRPTGQHRAQPGGGRRRAAPAAGKRRADVRPRYGRIAVLVAAATVTGIAVLGGFGVLPSGPEHASAAGSLAPSAKSLHDGGDTSGGAQGDTRSDGGQSTGSQSGGDGGLEGTLSARTTTPSGDADTDLAALPADSGTGRRVVFSESAQRVWLVGAGDQVQRTYLVSGSLTDNLDPGTYQVYSRSRWAVGIDDSGVMQYFVRFTQGDSGAAIGFHTIPAKDGVPLQTQAQLGTPQSHGCIRQRTSDAIALWDFAPTGTTVVVTA